jgi:hypothetical protein
MVKQKKLRPVVAKKALQKLVVLESFIEQSMKRYVFFDIEVFLGLIGFVLASNVAELKRRRNPSQLNKGLELGQCFSKVTATLLLESALASPGTAQST